MQIIERESIGKMSKHVLKISMKMISNLKMTQK